MSLWSFDQNFFSNTLFHSILLLFYVARAQLECFISDKARTANVLNDLKNDPSDEFIGEVKLNVVD
jgi:hypothetical protein